MAIFKTEISQNFNKKLINAIFDAINRDRDYEIIDRIVVYDVLNSFKTMMTLKKPKTMINPSDKQLCWTGTRIVDYKDPMSPLFMKSTNKYYQDRAQYLMDNFGIDEYIDRALISIEREEGSRDQWLNVNKKTKLKCVAMAVKWMISQNAENLMKKEPGIQDMFYNQ